MLRLSTYTELIGSAGVFSYTTGGFTEMDGQQMRLVRQGRLHELPREIFNRLLAQESLCGEGIDEGESMRERLVVQDKVTVLVCPAAIAEPAAIPDTAANAEPTAIGDTAFNVEPAATAEPADSADTTSNGEPAATGESASANQLRAPDFPAAVDHLAAYLRQNGIGQVSIIFVNPADGVDLSPAVASIERRLQAGGARLKECHFYVLADDQEATAVHLMSLKCQQGRLVCERLLKQILLWQEDGRGSQTSPDNRSDIFEAVEASKKGAPESSDIVEGEGSSDIVPGEKRLNTYAPGWPQTGLSWFGPNPAWPLPSDWRINKLKHSTQRAIILSNYRYCKELPLSGLVIDMDQIAELGTIRLHPQCRQCRLLGGCGGYGTTAVVRCPSYARWKDLPGLHHKMSGTTIASNTISGRPATEDVAQQASTGNSLSLNDAIIGLFDQMIAANNTPEETRLLDYLAHEYTKGFQCSKSGQPRLAAFLFSWADAITDTMDKRSFAWHWIQTHAASTKSYLAFKTGGYQRAIAITHSAMDIATRLLSRPSSEALAFFLSQMLLNKAKVLLTAHQYAEWEETMLANIHYLANLQPPPGYEDMPMQSIKKLDAGLRHWMLMEVIGQVLKFNLTNREQRHGDRLIANIRVTRQDAPLDDQLREWVRLNQAVERQDSGYISACLPAFMAAHNDRTSIGALQGYLRTRARKLLSDGRMRADPPPGAETSHLTRTRPQ